MTEPTVPNTQGLRDLIAKWRKPSASFHGTGDDGSVDYSYDATNLRCASELEALLPALESALTARVAQPSESAREKSLAARQAHCICSEAYGVGPEKCGAAVHHPTEAIRNLASEDAPRASGKGDR